MYFFVYGVKIALSLRILLLEDVEKGKVKKDMAQVNGIQRALIILWRKWKWKMYLRRGEDSHGIDPMVFSVQGMVYCFAGSTQAILERSILDHCPIFFGIR